MPYYISHMGEYGADATAEDIEAIRDKAIQESLVRAKKLALTNQTELLFLTPGWDVFSFKILHSATPELATQLWMNDSFELDNVHVRRATEFPESVCDKAVVWVLFPSPAEIEKLTGLYSNASNIVVTEGRDFGELDCWSQKHNAVEI